MQFRRPSSATPIRLPYFQTIAGRRLLWQAAIVAAAFLVGYLITVFWLFPAPFFSKDHAVPRVIDLGVSEARRKLEAQGFRFRVEDQQTDPTAPRNAVVWQDPPPGVVMPPNSQVSLVLSEGPPDVPVPDLEGFPRALAERVLKAAGLKAGKVDTVPAVRDPGLVVQTRPGPGVGRSAGTAIDLVVSSGPAEATVPTIVGLSAELARERLEMSGLVVGTTTARVVPGRPEGTVVEQRPAGGTRAARGTRVDLIVTQKGP